MIKNRRGRNADRNFRGAYRFSRGNRDARGNRNARGNRDTRGDLDSEGDSLANPAGRCLRASEAFLRLDEGSD